MNLNLAERGLSTDRQMAVAASDYQRSTAGIVLEIVVGLLSLGIGAIVTEAYHQYNRGQKNREFTELADALLEGMKGMPHPESGFCISYQGSSLDVSPEGNGIKLSYGNEIRIIPNKTMEDIRENLKAEVLSHQEFFDQKTIINALQDESPTQRALVTNFLSDRTSINKFDHLPTARLTQAAVDLLNDSTMQGAIENSLISSSEILEKVLDEESRELIQAWEKKSDLEKDQVIYTEAIEKTNPKDSPPSVSESDKKVRGLMGEIFFSERSWEMDEGDEGKRVKSSLIKNSDLLAEIYSNPDLLEAAELPAELSRIVKNTLQDIKQTLSISPGLVNSANLSAALREVPEQKYLEISLNIDRELSSFDFKSLDSVKMLSSISTMGEGNFQKFMANVFENYFDAQPVLDKRAMVASYLTNSNSNDAGEVKLVALLKAGGPYIQKILQLFGDKAEGALKLALDELKSGLSPINESLVKSVLSGIADKSRGKISKIDVTQSLGAASIGQAVLAKIHWNDKNEPQDVVIKILRPGVRLRAERELQFFENVASAIPGMSKTFEGISAQIQIEMDLSKEAKYVNLAQVYTGAEKNMQAMKLVDSIPPTQGYMVLEKAPGTTLKSAFDELDEKLASSLDASKDTPEVIVKLASGIKALTKKWIEEAFFGSGFYHGDLHAGNIMFSAEAGDSGMTTVIDMGNAAVLSVAQRSAVFKMVLAAGFRKPDVFVRNFENVLSDDGKNLIEQKREEFFALTSKIMQEITDPGEIIVKVLGAANQLGLEIPATVSNFSRSQMMLQNAINKINGIKKSVTDELINIVNKWTPLLDEDVSSVSDARAAAQRKLDEIDVNADPSPSDLAAKPFLEDLVKAADRLDRLEKHAVDFPSLIKEVVFNHKVDSAWLASGDLWQLFAKRA